MIPELVAQTVVVVQVLMGAVRQRARRRDDAGLSTLEMTILALGLLGLAGILIAALTVAINRRVGQIQ
jgi:membrane glycosyltransferase